MTCTHFRYLLWLILFQSGSLFAISMVYNFRIAQVTKQPISNDSNRNHTLVALLFDVIQKKYNGIFQNFAGAFGSFIYEFDTYYFRTDMALSHIKQKYQHIVFTDIETDDILFTIGKKFTLSRHATITYSGLFGIPTHHNFKLQHIDMGYGQVGFGCQVDGSYAFSETTGALVYGGRYVRFIPRNTFDSIHQRYRFTMGNFVDLLYAYKNSWDPYGIEFGYTSRFQFGARINQHINDITKQFDFIRSNFYLIHKYTFLVHSIANRLLFNLAYGFDHKPRFFGNKHVITIWGSWSINF
jgi:hypothetical protein